MARKNFDTLRAQRETGFTIGGEDFDLVAVPPEVLAKHMDMEIDPHRMMPQIDAFMLEAISTEGGAHARYKKLRARKTDALTLGDVQSLFQWVLDWQTGSLEDATGRPTEQPSSSTAGPPNGESGMRSMAASSSPGTPRGSRA